MITARDIDQESRYLSSLHGRTLNIRSPEMQELFELAQFGDSVAADKFFWGFASSALSVAGEYKRNSFNCAVPLEDLLSEALAALRRFVDFPPRHRVRKALTYARLVVRNAIRTYVLRCEHTVRNTSHNSAECDAPPVYSIDVAGDIEDDQPTRRPDHTLCSRDYYNQIASCLWQVKYGDILLEGFGFTAEYQPEWKHRIAKRDGINPKTLAGRVTVALREVADLLVERGLVPPEWRMVRRRKPSAKHEEGSRI